MPHKDPADRKAYLNEYNQTHKAEKQLWNAQWRAKNPRYRKPYDPADAQRRKAKAKELGLCSSCYIHARAEGRKTCQKCLDRAKQLREKRKAKGICDCGLATQGNAFCEKCLAKVKEKSRTLKEEVLEAYGGRCQCPSGICPEADKAFLTVDHVNNDGKVHKEEIGRRLYQWLKRNGFPKIGFRLLCWNCNCGRAANGGICPHELTTRFSAGISTQSQPQQNSFNEAN
jgi:hypothetical protein